MEHGVFLVLPLVHYVKGGVQTTCATIFTIIRKKFIIFGSKCCYQTITRCTIIVGHGGHL
jgi:hypothetical protein